MRAVAVGPGDRLRAGEAAFVQRHILPPKRDAPGVVRRLAVADEKEAH